MKVVVCDDCMEDLENIRGLLERYERTKEGTRLEAEYFTDSLEVYHRIQAKKQKGIYILDMIMSEKTGIDIGSLIRGADGESAIIYITSSDDFAMEAYGVHAARYLLKPVKEELFNEAMDYAVSSITREEKDALYPVKTKEGLVVIPYSKIEYIENYSRTLNVCVADGRNVKSIFIRGSFEEEIRQVMENKNFIRVHKSFVVNLRYVGKLTQNGVIMENETRIPVSKARASDVKREYLKFVSGQYSRGVIK